LGSCDLYGPQFIAGRGAVGLFTTYSFVRPCLLTAITAIAATIAATTSFARSLVHMDRSPQTSCPPLNHLPSFNRY
jgi:hypothetical protein